MSNRTQTRRPRFIRDREALCPSSDVADAVVRTPERTRAAWAKAGPLMTAAIRESGYSEAFALEIVKRMKPLFLLTEVNVDPPTAAELGDYARHVDALADVWPWVEARYSAISWRIVRERLYSELLYGYAAGWR